MSVRCVAFGARSALGRGSLAVGSLVPGEPAVTRVAPDARLLAGGLVAAAVARADDALPPTPATSLLLGALGDAVSDLEAVSPGWRGLRVGLAIGTSSAELHRMEAALRALAAGSAPAHHDAPWMTYGAPFLRARDSLGVPLAREASVLAACASSAVAVGLAATWVRTGACDVAFAGGYDAVSDFVASGFASLLAVTRTVPRPFREGRDGLGLGEGAAILALAREGAPRFFVDGFFATTDALHVTAPAKDGRELARAAEGALRQAGCELADVGLVSLHGTGTVANDDAEARVAARFDAPAFATKASTGHTLGASGALEALHLGLALEARIAPATAGEGEVIEGVGLLDANRAHDAETGLKLSAAFGGANAALVLSRSGRSIPPATPLGTATSARVHVDASFDPAATARRAAIPLERLPRLDRLSLLGIEAALRLREALPEGALHGAGVVVHSAYATLSTNHAFVRRLVERGLRGAEPRRFPYTSPNSVAGEIAIALGLHGPSLAVGGHPALGEAHARGIANDLVAAGLAPAILLVTVEDPGSAVDAAAAALGLAAPPPYATAALVTTASI